MKTATKTAKKPIKNNLVVITTAIDGTPEFVVTPALKVAAKKHHAEWMALNNGIKKSFVSMGKILDAMITAKEHLALGFDTFEEYIGKYLGTGKTQAFEAMKIVRELGSGSKPAVKLADLQKMTRNNAKQVMELKKAKGKVTPKVVKAAQELTETEFHEEYVAPAIKKNGGKAKPKTKATAPNFKATMTKRGIARMNFAHKIAESIAKGGKAWEMIADEFIAKHEAAYAKAQEKLNEEVA